LCVARNHVVGRVKPGHDAFFADESPSPIPRSPRPPNPKRVAKYVPIF
jgi:hypothetical protein